MALPFCFDAVFFDLDGTLIATDRLWLESAERGARRAFQALGRVRDLPTAKQWMSLVGLPLEVGFRSLFSDLSEAERRTVLAACVEEEELMLARSGAPIMADAREVLRALHSAGLALGIASNCEQSYLEHMLDGLGVGGLLSGAYCAETPGIGSKADMLARLLADLGTRSAVMVGDRASDRDAAWANGLPHIHCEFGFAQGDESVEAEGRIASLAELGPRLARRGMWIDEALERLGERVQPGRRLGITGGPCAGKTLFARDVARILQARDHSASAVSLADFADGLSRAGGPSLGGSVDLERLEGELLGPHRGGREVCLARPDLLGRDRVPAGATLILEGADLLGSPLGSRLDGLIHLDVPEHLSCRRSLVRGVSAHALKKAWQKQRRLEQSFPPRDYADLVLDAANPLGS